MGRMSNKTLAQFYEAKQNVYKLFMTIMKSLDEGYKEPKPE